MRLHTSLVTPLVFGLVLLLPTHSYADKLCIKQRQKIKKNRVALGSVLRVEDECPNRFIEILDTDEFMGAMGAPGADGADGTNGTNGTNGVDGTNGTNGTNGTDGADGADGSLRVYGDGSAGAKTVSANETLSDTNLMYTDFTVAAGQTLTVESGMVIRCTGSFTNNGTIQVQQPENGAILEQNQATTLTDGTELVASRGVAVTSATNGELGTNAVDLYGGRGGTNISQLQSRFLRYPGVHAGGGGGAGFDTSDPPITGNGGGSLVVLCQGTITNANTGTISADGDAGDEGSGGGAGGVVILASAQNVTNAGTIQANGANGSASTTRSAAGGGGGGGIIHLISPVTSNTGTLSVSGGSLGDSTTAVTGSLRSGGGGGGGCGGVGGNGRNLTSGNVQLSGFAGGNGHAIQTNVDPAPLF